MLSIICAAEAVDELLEIMRPHFLTKQHTNMRF